MKYSEVVDDLVTSIKEAGGPKEAEWLLQDAITALLRKRTGKPDFACFIYALYEKLLLECSEAGEAPLQVRLNSVISIVEDYRTLFIQDEENDK